MDIYDNNNEKYVNNIWGFTSKVKNITKYKAKFNIYKGTDIITGDTILFYGDDIFNTLEELQQSVQTKIDNHLMDFSEKVKTKEGFIKILIDVYENLDSSNYTKAEVCILLAQANKLFDVDLNDYYENELTTEELITITEKYI